MASLVSNNQSKFVLNNSFINPIFGSKIQDQTIAITTAGVINGKKYPSITNVGAQPTVNGNSEVIETYIDGFSGNLYGENLTVYFVDFIRDIKKFDNLDCLKEQLLKDKRSLYD